MVARVKDAFETELSEYLNRDDRANQPLYK